MSKRKTSGDASGNGDASRLNGRSLAHRLMRELDANGLPRGLDVRDWWPTVVQLCEANESSAPGSDERRLESIRSLAAAAVRFARTDGSPVFTDGGDHPTPERLIRAAHSIGDERTGAVLRRWFPRLVPPERRASPPHLPAIAAETVPIAMLRADWSKSGDFLAVDDRAGGPACLIELQGGGVRWLGSNWRNSLDETGPRGAGRQVTWSTDSKVDIVEWEYELGRTRVQRSALLARGRKLAIVAEFVERLPERTRFEARIAVPKSLTAAAANVPGGLVLKSGSSRSAHVLAPNASVRSNSDGQLHVVSRSEGETQWLPLLISWDSARNRKPLICRPVTVSSERKACSPQEAQAYWISWGRSESYVVFRSSGPAKPRAFLGHQTDSGFLFGVFTKTGDVEPLVEIE